MNSSKEPALNCYWFWALNKSLNDCWPEGMIIWDKGKRVIDPCNLEPNPYVVYQNSNFWGKPHPQIKLQ